MHSGLIQFTRRLFCSAAILLWLLRPALSGAAPLEMIEARRLADDAPHNAFTDLVRWKDAWWCVFREATAHVGGDGAVPVLTSADGVKWERAAVVAETGIDLRDPKLSVTPDDRLMLVTGGSVYRGGTVLLGRQPRVAFSKDGRKWSVPQRVLGENDWLWRVTWFQGTAWGAAYHTDAPEGTTADTGEWTLTLYRSQDGLTWERGAVLDIPGRPNETTLRFRPDGECLALVRRESGDRQGWFGKAKAPYRDWKWQPIGRAIGGPELLILADGRVLACGRDYRPSGTVTAIGFMEDGRWDASTALPSGGDTSYPGMVEHEGTVRMTYYTSHEGKSAVWLASVRIPADPREVRPAKDDADLRAWLENMIRWHHFTNGEVRAVLGLTDAEIEAAKERFGIRPDKSPPRAPDAPLVILPWPGGRHPRIGFLDGAVNPQRETKLSIFPPWPDGGYVVLDAPEAIWSNLGLTWLAHTHIPDIWKREGITLPRTEWQRQPDGRLISERTLPNGIAFKVTVIPAKDHAALTMSLHNGTNATLTNLRVQMCAMLAGATGFSRQSTDGRIYDPPFAAASDVSGRRWVIHAWQPYDRGWSNPQCPCLHADPKFPDCPAGSTVEIRGRLSFYEGDDIRGELRRIGTLWK